MKRFCTISTTTLHQFARNTWTRNLIGRDANVVRIFCAIFGFQVNQSRYMRNDADVSGIKSGLVGKHFSRINDREK